MEGVEVESSLKTALITRKLQQFELPCNRNWEYDTYFNQPTNVTENSPLESCDWLVDVRHLCSFVITSFGLSEMGAY